MKKKDNVNPEHYKIGGIETFDFICAKLSPEEVRGFIKGNLIKYMSRANHKGGPEDIKKSNWYLKEYVGRFL